MISWIVANAGTIAAALIVLAVAGGALFVVLRDKKRGKSSCGCNCAHCAMAGSCHGKQSK